MRTDTENVRMYRSNSAALIVSHLIGHPGVPYPSDRIPPRVRDSSPEPSASPALLAKPVLMLRLPVLKVSRPALQVVQKPHPVPNSALSEQDGDHKNDATRRVLRGVHVAAGGGGLHDPGTRGGRELAPPDLKEFNS